MDGIFTSVKYHEAVSGPEGSESIGGNSPIATDTELNEGLDSTGHEKDHKLDETCNSSMMRKGCSTTATGGIAPSARSAVTLKSDVSKDSEGLNRDINNAKSSNMASQPSKLSSTSGFSPNSPAVSISPSLSSSGRPSSDVKTSQERRMLSTLPPCPSGKTEELVVITPGMFDMSSIPLVTASPGAQSGCTSVVFPGDGSSPVVSEHLYSPEKNKSAEAISYVQSSKKLQRQEVESSASFCGNESTSVANQPSHTLVKMASKGDVTCLKNSQRKLKEGRSGLNTGERKKSITNEPSKRKSREDTCTKTMKRKLHKARGETSTSTSRNWIPAPLTNEASDKVEKRKSEECFLSMETSQMKPRKVRRTGASTATVTNAARDKPEKRRSEVEYFYLMQSNQRKLQKMTTELTSTCRNVSSLPATNATQEPISNMVTDQETRSILNSTSTSSKKSPHITNEPRPVPMETRTTQGAFCMETSQWKLHKARMKSNMSASSPLVVNEDVASQRNQNQDEDCSKMEIGHERGDILLISDESVSLSQKDDVDHSSEGEQNVEGPPGAVSISRTSNAGGNMQGSPIYDAIPMKKWELYKNAFRKVFVDRLPLPSTNTKALADEATCKTRFEFDDDTHRSRQMTSGLPKESCEKETDKLKQKGNELPKESCKEGMNESQQKGNETLQESCEESPKKPKQKTSETPKQSCKESTDKPNEKRNEILQEACEKEMDKPKQMTPETQKEFCEDNVVDSSTHDTQPIECLSQTVANLTRDHSETPIASTPTSFHNIADNIKGSDKNEIHQDEFAQLLVLPVRKPLAAECTTCDDSHFPFAITHHATPPDHLVTQSSLDLIFHDTPSCVHGSERNASCIIIRAANQEPKHECGPPSIAAVRPACDSSVLLHASGDVTPNTASGVQKSDGNKSRIVLSADLRKLDMANLPLNGKRTEDGELSDPINSPNQLVDGSEKTKSLGGKTSFLCSEKDLEQTGEAVEIRAGVKETEKVANVSTNKPVDRSDKGSSNHFLEGERKMVGAQGAAPNADSLECNSQAAKQVVIDLPKSDSTRSTEKLDECTSELAEGLSTNHAGIVPVPCENGSSETGISTTKLGKGITSSGELNSMRTSSVERERRYVLKESTNRRFTRPENEQNRKRLFEKSDSWRNGKHRFKAFMHYNQSNSNKYCDYNNNNVNINKMEEFQRGFPEETNPRMHAKRSRLEEERRETDLRMYSWQRESCYYPPRHADTSDRQYASRGTEARPAIYPSRGAAHQSRYEPDQRYERAYPRPPPLMDCRPGDPLFVPSLRPQRRPPMFTNPVTAVTWSVPRRQTQFRDSPSR